MALGLPHLDITELKLNFTKIWTEHYIVYTHHCQTGRPRFSLQPDNKCIQNMKDLEISDIYFVTFSSRTNYTVHIKLLIIMNDIGSIYNIFYLKQLKKKLQ